MHRKVQFQSERLVEQCRELLATMPEGQRFPSTRELERRFSANRRVVFAALNRMMEEGLLRVKPRIGCYSTGTLCVRAVPVMQLLTPEYPSQWLATFIDELMRYAAKSGRLVYRLRRYDYEYDSFARCLDADCAAAAFIAPSRGITREELRHIVDFPRPLLAISKHFEDLPLCSIVKDEQADGVLAARCLLARGHRKLGVLICEPRMYGIDIVTRSFAETVETAGSSCTIIDCRTVCGEFTPQISYDTLSRYLERPELQFTALFLINDTAASGVMRAIVQAGYSVPGEISLLGYGDTPDDSGLPVPLSTIGVDSASFARNTSETLLRMVESPERAFHVTLKSKLFERSSVRTLPSF